MIDRWQASDRLTIETQLRGDWYEETQIDWSGRLSSLYALNEEKTEIFRLSAAKAFRAPLAGLRQAEVSRMQVMGLNFININKLERKELENEQTYSFEAGYTAHLDNAAIFRIDGYYQRFDKLIGSIRQDDPLGFGRAFNTIKTLDGADSYGVETELEFSTDFGKFALWYAFNDFHENKSHQTLRAYLPAQHKFGARARLFLNNDWTANINYRYTDTTLYDPVGSAVIPENAAMSSRLDLTLAKKLWDGDGELMMGVEDIFNRQRDPVSDRGSLTSHKTPGRMYFARFQMRF